MSGVEALILLSERRDGTNRRLIGQTETDV
jgi:hypothetical protein